MTVNWQNLIRPIRLPSRGWGESPFELARNVVELLIYRGSTNPVPMKSVQQLLVNENLESLANSVFIRR